MATEWFYLRGNTAIGPVSGRVLKQLAAVGEILPTDLVSKVGSRSWRQARVVNGLFAPSINTAQPNPIEYPPTTDPYFNNLGSESGFYLDEPGLTPSMDSTRRWPVQYEVLSPENHRSETQGSLFAIVGCMLRLPLFIMICFGLAVFPIFLWLIKLPIVPGVFLYAAFATDPEFIGSFMALGPNLSPMALADSYADCWEWLRGELGWDEMNERLGLRLKR